MQKNFTQEQLDDTYFHYRNFHENLQEKLDPQEITSLNVLGKDFFTLIDHIVSSVFIDHANDSFLLELNLQDFLWETQIFVNQYIRSQVSSVLKLKSFCKTRLELLQNPLFYSGLMKDVEEAYTKHFFSESNDSSYLV